MPGMAPNCIFGWAGPPQLGAEIAWLRRIAAREMEGNEMKAPGYSILAAMFSVALAHASILPPTGSPPVAPDVFGTPVTGPFLADTGLQSFGSATTLYDEVVYADPSNVFCAGCLDFLIYIANDPSSTYGITAVLLGVDVDDNYLTDVGYSTGPGGNPGGVVPSTVSRSAFTSSIIEIDFNTPNVGPGESTQELEIQTNATSFAPGGDLYLWTTCAPNCSAGFGTGGNPAFAPATVPEAGSLSMTLGGALLGIGFIGCRRRKVRILAGLRT